MKYRRLGKSGPQVSAVGHGRGSQPVRSGEPLEADFNATIRRALDLGISFFDSSNAYWGGGTPTALPIEDLGRVVRAFRASVAVSGEFTCETQPRACVGIAPAKNSIMSV